MSVVLGVVLVVGAFVLGLALGFAAGHFVKAGEAFDAGYWAAQDALRDKRVSW
jgi:hypothetical protein